MKTLTAAALVALIGYSASAGWTLSGDKKTVTDGVWTFNVTVDDAKGTFTLGAVAVNPSVVSDLDLTTVNEDIGYTMTAYSSMRGNLKLASIAFPEEGVTVIGNQTFSGCTSLTNVVLPKTVKRFDYAAFQNCTALRRVTPFLPDSVTDMAGYVFAGCTALEGDLKLRGMVNFGNRTDNCYTFQKTKVTSVDFGTDNRLKVVGAYVFDQVTTLTNVTPLLPGSVEYVGASSFSKNTGIVGDVCATNAVCFAGFDTTGITSVRLCDRIESLGTLANCASLTNVWPAFPPTLKSVPGGTGFANCTSLKGDFVFSNTNVTTFCQQFLKDTQVASLAVPPTFKNFSAWMTLGSKALTNVSVCAVSGMRRFPVTDGTLSGNQLFASSSPLVSFEFPFRGAFTSGGSSAKFFTNCAKLTRVKFWGKAPTKENFYLWNSNTRCTVFVSREQDEAGWLALPTSLYTAENPAPADAPANCFGSSVKADYGAPLWFVWERSPYDPQGLAIILR